MRKKREKDSYSIAFGDSLRDIRLQHNLTQEQVSQLMDCDAKYISQIENGLYMGNIRTLLKFCTIYNVTPNDILQDFLPTLASFSDQETENFCDDFLKLSKKDKKNVIALIKSMLSN